MAEVVDVNIWALIWSVFKYVVTGFITVIGMFCLWMLGKLNSIIGAYKDQHLEMYSHYQDSTGKSALLLQSIKEEEWKSLVEGLKQLQHDVNALRQDKLNMEILFREIRDRK